MGEIKDSTVMNLFVPDAVLSGKAVCGHIYCPEVKIIFVPAVFSGRAYVTEMRRFFLALVRECLWPIQIAAFHQKWEVVALQT